MSRFFHGGDSDSESSPSEEEELYSEESEEQEESEEESDEEDSDDDSSDDELAGKTGASRFMRDVDSDTDSEDEDEKTVVKSAKDKRFEEFEKNIGAIENAMKINDWAAINTGMFSGSGLILVVLIMFYSLRRDAAASGQDYHSWCSTESIYQDHQ